MLQVSKSPVSIKALARSRNVPADSTDGSFLTTAIVLAIFCGLGLAASLAVYTMAPVELLELITLVQ